MVETGTLPPDGVRTMFDRIAPVYDVMNRVMTAGLDRRWRASSPPRRRAPGRPRARRVLRHRRSRARRLRPARRRRHRARLLAVDARAGARARRPTSSGSQGDLLALPFADGSFDAATVGFGVRNVADLALALRELRRVLVPGGRLGDPRDHAAARSRCAPFYSLWFDRVVPLLGRVLPGGAAYTLPARDRARASRAPDELAALMRDAGLRRRPLPAARRLDRRAAHRERPRERARRRSARRPGSTAYLERARGAAARRRSPPTRASSPPSAARRSRPAASGCGRCSSSSRLRPGSEPPTLAAGVAVELVHMATLVHDDLIDGARVPARPRRGLAGVRPGRGARGRRLPLRPRVRRAGGDRRRRGGRDARRRDARPRARRGAAAQPDARPGHDRRRLPRALRAEDREAVRGRLPARLPAAIAASARSGSRSAIAFQIADDILDCAGQTQETGKIAGTDLREGTPTLPLLLAAQEDEVVRRALAGGPLDGALVRVAATDALDALARGRARLRCERPGRT